MAVMRVQSIKVESSLRSALKHRFSPPQYEILCMSALKHDGGEEFHKLFEAFKGTGGDLLKEYEEFFRIAESKGYRQKIRKNAVVYEVVVSYSDEDLRGCGNPLVCVRRDYESFLESFEERFGFRPFSAVFVHKDKRNNRYHMHILFSLMKPDLSKKIRWNSKVYFELARSISQKSRWIRFSDEKKAGVYPLWLVRRFEQFLGVWGAKKFLKVARSKGLRAGELVDLLKIMEQKRLGYEDLLSFLDSRESRVRRGVGIKP